MFHLLKWGFTPFESLLKLKLKSGYAHLFHSISAEFDLHVLFWCDKMTDKIQSTTVKDNWGAPSQKRDNETKERATWRKWEAERGWGPVVRSDK